MQSGSDTTDSSDATAGYPGFGNTTLTLKLIAWAAGLGLGLALSFSLGWFEGVPSSTAQVGFATALAAGYLAVFAHCFMRLVYSRWPSWLLFTAGFAGLSMGRATGVFAGLGLMQDPAIKESYDLLRSAMLPVAAALMLTGAHASRARLRGRRTVQWKSVLKTLFLAAVGIVAWRVGALGVVGECLRASNLKPELVVDFTSAAALVALIHRNHRLAFSEHDEIVVPVCYWCVAMIFGTAVSIVNWNEPNSAWWQVKCLEVAGLAAMTVGLTLGNERAHRQSASQMTDLQAMQRISWSLVGAAELSGLCAALAKSICESLHASAVVVYLPGENEEELAVAADYGIDHPSVSVGKSYSLKPGFRPGFHNGHTSRAFSSGEVQTVSEILSDPEFLPWRRAAQEYGTVVSVPLPHAGKTIGVINLMLSGVSSVDQGRIKLFEALAAAVAPAIENTLLESESEQESVAA